jgi:hypothetical protein
MKKILLFKIFVLVLTSLGHVSFGQTLKIVPPTPNAMKMTEYYAQRPNMYTGTANVSIPLYTIDFDGMSLPLSISYNATGIRTNEEASEVGLGWALNATGVISRTVRGFDDFYPGGVGDGRGQGYVYNRIPMPDPFDFGYDQITTRIPSGTSYYAYLVSSRPDTEPDIFNYNFFGYSGQFVLSQKEKDPNDRVIKAIKLTEDATSIIFNETPNKTFTIITPDGYKGEFTAKELSTSMSGTREGGTDELACGEDKINFQYLLNESGQFKVISSWYLTKITSPRGQEINFNYDLDANGNSFYLSYNRAFGEDNDLLQSPICLHTIHENVYLKDITYNNNVKVQFLMEEREDMRKNELFTPASIAVHLFPYSQNLKRYRQMVVTGLDQASTLNKTITFNQSYFNQQYHKKYANDENELIWLRSKLDRITIDNQEYKFSYYNGSKGLPQKHTRAVDHFGFYNGKDFNAHLLYPFTDECICVWDCSTDPTVPEVIYHYKHQSNRLVDFNFGQAGLLKKIIYPTRGYTTFEYESHDYIPQQVNGMIEIGAGGGIGGGARIKSIKEFDYTGTMTRSRSYRYTLRGEIDLINPIPSTGRLMTQLLNRGKQPLFIFGDPASGQPEVRYTCNWLIEPNTSIPGNNAAEGKIIGYSTVHEIVEGAGSNYKNSYFFENEPNKILTSLLAVDGQANINGQVKEVRNYNSDGKIVQRTENSGYKDIQLNPVKGVAYRASIINNTYLNYRQEFDIRRTFTTPTMVKTTTTPTPSGIVENPTTGDIVTYGSVLETAKKFSYNSNYLLKTEETINSQNETLKKEYKRASDYPVTNVQTRFMLKSDVNLVSPTIEEITWRNGKVVAASANFYSLYNLMSTYEYNPNLGSFVYLNQALNDGQTAFQTPYEIKTNITSFSSLYKPQEYTNQDGVTHSFIWGYSGMLPIVHGVGIKYNKLLQAHNNSLLSANYETALRSDPSTLGGQVTSYTHNPLIGISKITDPLGLKKTFQYDLFGRLKKVLDEDDNTIEQYDYNLKFKPDTKILTVTGDLNFGTLTQDIFAPRFNPKWISCSDYLRSKILTISNTGEDDLTIYNLVTPTEFISSWQGGVIPAGEKIDVIISFNGSLPSLAFGTYSGTISISSDKTNTVSGDTQPISFVYIPVSAIYAQRNCNISVSPSPLLDFGTVTSGFTERIVTIINNGNAPINLTGQLFDWDGVTIDNGQFVHPDFGITALPTYNTFEIPMAKSCIGVGQSKNVSVYFLPKGYGPTSTKLSLTFEECTKLKDVVTIQGDRHQIKSIISMDTSPIDFGTFTEAFKTAPITITNTGDLGFTVNGISVADGTVASWFTLSPSTWTLDPGASKNFVLTFQPAVKDVTANSTITINNDAMYGNETFAVTGRRYSLRKMVLSTEPSNLLVFDNPNEIKPITITNASISNDDLSVNDFSPLNASLLGWAVTNFTPGVLVPGQSMTMQVMRTGAAPADQTITIGSNKNDGVNSFTLKNGVTRVIGLTTSPSTTLPAFSTPSISQNITVSNSGTGLLTVGGITSSNAMFTVSPSTVTVAANSQQTVTITFTPTAFNFSQQSATLTFTSDATSGTGTITIIGQRTRVRTIQLSSNSLIFDFTGQTQNVTVTNSSASNDYMNVTGVSYPSTPNWFASITPALLLPGQSTTLAITRTTGANEPLSFTVNSDKFNGNEVVQVGANTRIIGISPASITLPSFSAASISQNITVSNTGNSTLNVTGTPSSNSMFTASPSSFTVASGSQQTVTITFTPTAFNFASQATTLTFNSDKTSGTNTINVTGQRTSLKTIQVSPNSLVFDPPLFVAKNVTVTNVGNDNLNITGVSNPNTIDWTASITAITLAPNQSTNLSILQKTPVPSPAVTNISVTSDKNGGNEVAQVSANTRIISISGVTFPSFTTVTASQPMTISNSGNSPLIINSITSSNSKFTISLGSFTIPAGGNQIVTVTYTPTDFTLQSTTLTISSNSSNSGGTNSVSTSAQRNLVRIIQLSSNSLTFSFQFQQQTVTVSNVGTDNLNVTGVSYLSTSNWSASITTANLAPGQSTTMTIIRLGANPETLSISVLSNKTNGNEIIQVSK